jgi:hypothetical protein
MANLALAFDVLAKDHASKTFNDVGNAAARAGQKGERFGKLMHAAGKVAFAGLATGAAGLGAAFLKGAKDAADMQKITAQTAAVLKSTGGAAGLTARQVNELGNQIEGYSAFGNDAVQAGENMLLTFTNIRNEAGKGNDVFTQSTKILADMSTALGVDMKTQAIQLGKALNDPIKGISALQRVGVSFTASQRTQIKTLVESGKTMDAQKVILAELSKEFGGSAAAAGKTFSGSLARLRNQIGDVLRDFASPALPAFTSAVGWLGSKALPALTSALSVAFGTIKRVTGEFFAGLRSEGGRSGQTLFDLGVRAKAALGAASTFITGTVIPAMKGLWAFITGSLLPSINNLIEAVTPALLGALIAVTSAGVKLFEGALKTLGPVLTAVTGFLRDHKTATKVLAVSLLALLAVTKAHAAFLAVEAVGGLKKYLLQMNLVTVATKTWAAVQWLVNAALDANPIGLVVIALAALVAGTIYAYKHFETFREVVKAVFHAVAGFVLSAIDLWLGAYQKLFQAMSHIPIIGKAFGKVADAIGSVRDKVHGLKDDINGLPKNTNLKITTTMVTLGQGPLANKHLPIDGIGSAGYTGTSRGGLTVQHLEVHAAPGEPAAESVPRSLRAMALRMGY